MKQPKAVKLCATCRNAPISDKNVNYHCDPCEAVYKKGKRNKRREEVLRHYSNGDPKCACCGVGHLVFLVIDHIDGGGAEHRRALRTKNGHQASGTAVYAWLKRNGYPPGFRVLCHNCNWAFRMGGNCPHQPAGEVTKCSL